MATSWPGYHRAIGRRQPGADQPSPRGREWLEATRAAGTRTETRWPDDPFATVRRLVAPPADVGNRLHRRRRREPFANHALGATAAVGICPRWDAKDCDSTPTVAPAAEPSGSGTASEWILYDPMLDAPAAIEAALADAGADGKRVLLEFGADWCPDCHVLNSYLQDPRAKTILNASYHVVRIDVGYFDRNVETAQRYGNVIGVGIPSVVILDAQGTKLVDTAAGELADSSRYTVDDIVEFVSSWAT